MFTLFRRRSGKTAVDRDADRMIRELGEQAYVAAGEMSWREDAGLLGSCQPGHWHRVQQEIGDRLGRLPADESVVWSAQPRKPREILAGMQ